MEEKENLLSFLKTQYVKHLTTQKIKGTKYIPCELVLEDNERFIYLPRCIPYIINKDILIEWFIACLIKNIRGTL